MLKSKKDAMFNVSQETKKPEFSDTVVGGVNVFKTLKTT